MILLTSFRIVLKIMSRSGTGSWTTWPMNSAVDARSPETSLTDSNLKKKNTAAQTDVYV